MSEGEDDECVEDVKAENDDDTIKETKDNSGGDSEEESNAGEKGKDTPMEDQEDEEEAE